ncbi:MAG: major facilitator superfamily transporter [Bacteroidetes bacterium]|nr:MAG: major facilitator superfamily transporter [Bacteroidota bacterium]
MKRTILVLISLAIGHGLNDFIAGFLLAKSVNDVSALWNISLFTIYSAIAFGGQVPLALLIGRTGGYKAWTVAAFALMTAAVILHPFSNMAAIIVSGFASAIYHVSGGALSIVLPGKPAASAGFFSAPGVIGLTLGGFFIGRMDFNLLWILLPVLACAGVLLFSEIKNEKQVASQNKPEAGFEVHDGIMLLLLLVIAFRSAVWDIYQVIYYSKPDMMLWIALAAAAGKLLGGVLAERYNQVNYLSASLFSSVVLLQFSQKHPVFLLAGIAVLQSTIPACILLFNRFLGNMPAMSNALVLGLAIVLGAFPYHFSSENIFYWVSGALFLMTLGFFGIMRRMR